MTDTPQTTAEDEDRSTMSERLTDVDRRKFLQTAGVAGGATLLGASARPVAAETHWKDRRADDWEQQADQRIADNQMGDVEVVVEDTEGRPVPNADVSVVMQNHDFKFGTAVNARVFVNQTSEGDNYRTYIHELFNTAVLENGHKWRFWENNQDRADQTTQWLIDHGLDVRGHACIWGRQDVEAIPDDVLTAANNGDAQTIRDRSTQHIQDIITHYEGQIDEWEVVNEAMHVFTLQKGVYGDQINSDEPWNGDVVPWTSELLSTWYQTAQDAAGGDMTLGVNDFNALEGQWPYTIPRYPNEIDSIQSSGVDIQSIGFQCHVGARTSNPGANSSDPDGRLTYSEINERLAEFEGYDANLKITEFDMYKGSDWSGQDERADVLHNYLKTAYGHPQITEFILWGFWDGRHWESEAPLFYEDWREKPAFDVWDHLLFNEWWTDESGTADGSGVYTTSAYLGTHEVTASADGESTTTTVDITDPDGTTTVTVTVDAETTPTPTETTTPEGPPAIDGTVPQDIDGDGIYGDFNANGDIDFPDVNIFFQNSDTDPIQNNAQYFDFTGEGEITIQDVMALFRRV